VILDSDAALKVQLNRPAISLESVTKAWSAPTEAKLGRRAPGKDDSLLESLHHLQRLSALGTMAAGCSHEIKNAMVAVRTFVELLLAENKDSELAGIVRREILRIDHVVAQMLRLAAPPRKRRAALGINDLLERVLKLAQTRFPNGQGRCNLLLRATPDLIQGDVQQLEQAFLNLCLNAFEAMSGEGELTIRSSRSARSSRGRASARNYLRVSIADTGGGISAARLPRLFEPFFTTKPAGTGLGLAITRQIIEQHGGTISLESEPGKGTTFHVSLPVEVTQSASA